LQEIPNPFTHPPSRRAHPFMKRFALLLFLLAGLAPTGFAQGIDFFHGTWAEAQAKAQAENKLIFVDAYAVWCGPCKRMASQVFTKPEAGEFYNANFINLKIDMEKAENAEFASKYPVSAYPTLFFLDATGKVVMKQVGGQDVSGLLDLGQKALGKTDKSMDFEKAYADGNRDPKFMYDYVCALNRAGKPSLKITNEYLNTQKDFTTPFNLRFLLEGATESDSRVFNLLVQHRDKVIALENKEAVEKRIQAACINTVRKAVEFRNEELLAEAKAQMAKGIPARAEVFGYEADMKYFGNGRDAKRYLKAAQGYQKAEVKNNSARLHDLVVLMLRAFPNDEPKVLDQARKWAVEAADKGGLPEYSLTLAEVYKRQGNKPKAREAAEKAKELAGEKDNGVKAKADYFLQSLESR
jgi:thiol-disulfide isomerase/thioredoxin